MDFAEAKQRIDCALNAKNLLLVIGNCYVEYWGRAASKLPKGNRMLIIKGDNSFAIHQNKKLNAINYMIGSKISCSIDGNSLLLLAQKTRPKEHIKVYFYDVSFLQDFEMQDTSDIRLFGSEREISNQLMQDLSFIEKGLKPVNQEEMFRKGIVDILAEDKKGRLVVVEVKRRQADYQAVQQLHRYMHQVKSLKNIGTRGILVAPGIGKNALELLENYGLEFAKLDFEVGNPEAKIKGVQRKQKTIFEALK